MFRISVIVEDKKLPQALTVLNGLCYNLEVAPVVTEPALPKEPKAKKSRAPAHSTTSMVLTLLQEHAAKDPNDNRVYSAPMVNEAVSRWGGVKSSVYNGFTRLVANGTLSRVPGVSGQYILNRSKL